MAPYAHFQPQSPRAQWSRWPASVRTFMSECLLPFLSPESHENKFPAEVRPHEVILACDRMRYSEWKMG